MASTNQTSAIDRYQPRLAELDQSSVEDEITIDKKSREQLLNFLTSNPNLEKVALVLSYEGHYRLETRAGDGNHIGLRFLGDGIIRYVIFHSGLDTADDRYSGTGTWEAISVQLDALGMSWMLFGE